MTISCINCKSSIHSSRDLICSNRKSIAFQALPEKHGHWEGLVINNNYPLGFLRRVTSSWAENARFDARCEKMAKMCSCFESER
jgi:hypothetical protein